MQKEVYMGCFGRAVRFCIVFVACLFFVSILEHLFPPLGSMVRVLLSVVIPIYFLWSIVAGVMYSIKNTNASYDSRRGDADWQNMHIRQQQQQRNSTHRY